MNAVAAKFSDVAAVLRSAEERFTAENPLSRARFERACDVFPGGHTRQTLYYAPFPVTIVRGAGARVTDLDGHEYLNTIGEYAAGVYGHTCEPIQRAVREALQGGVSLAGVNNREMELAEVISSRISSMQLVRFCNSGSEACLFSALTAQHVTKRRKILVFNGCYHGGFMIYGAIDPPLSVPFELVKCTFNDIEGTRSALRANANTIAAVMVEPVMGAGGCLPATEEFLKMLRVETRQHGIILIFDEVGSSRLAPGGIQGLFGIVPDMTTLGKFWGGGFNFGAFGGSREIMRHFDLRSGGLLSQGGTFNNNIITMTAGLTGARDVYTPEVCIKLNKLGDTLREAINALGIAKGVALQATGSGAMMNTHWQRGHITHPGEIAHATHPLRRLFQLEMLSHGFYAAQRGIITLSLPFTEQDVELFLSAITDYVKEYGGLIEAQQ
jgi:glutamate-1-semialdehyde 2,1-aminomutase